MIYSSIFLPYLKIYSILFGMLKPKRKVKVIQKNALHKQDTGSAEVQISIFTEEIKQLAKHLKKHQKDESSRSGLLKMVSKRRRLLEYLKKEDSKRYGSIIKSLGLKR